MGVHLTLREVACHPGPAPCHQCSLRTCRECGGSATPARLVPAPQHPDIAPAPSHRADSWPQAAFRLVHSGLRGVPQSCWNEDQTPDTGDGGWVPRPGGRSSDSRSGLQSSSFQHSGAVRSHSGKCGLGPSHCSLPQQPCDPVGGPEDQLWEPGPLHRGLGPGAAVGALASRAPGRGRHQAYPHSLLQT